MGRNSIPPLRTLSRGPKFSHPMSSRVKFGWGSKRRDTVYKARPVLLPLCLSIMTLPTNAAKDTPIADPVPSDEEAEDVEAIRLLLEARKAKNEKNCVEEEGARGGEEEGRRGRSEADRGGG